MNYPGCNLGKETIIEKVCIEDIICATYEVVFMYISKIIVRNFRILENVTFELENDLSLIIGKNNTGKTSLLKVLSRFFDEKKTNQFRFDDFSLNTQTQIINAIKNNDDSCNISIDVLLIIEFNEQDDLSNIDSLFVDLESSSKHVVLKVSYKIEINKWERLKTDLEKYIDCDNATTKKLTYTEKIHNFMNKRMEKYFSRVCYNVPVSTIDNKDEEIKKQRELPNKKFKKENVISFKSIKARRKNDNKYKDDSLSSLTQKYFNLNKSNITYVNSFEDLIINSDKKFTQLYEDMFSKILNSIAQFGGINKEGSKLCIVSELNTDKLLSDNTKVVYELDNNVVLPESYNGLGYLNLINVVLQLHLIIEEFKREYEDKDPACINLIFIEEPEAYMHPQLQAIFIKNINQVIKALTGASKKQINLQLIISTHSAHVVSQCVFDSIKYMRRTDNCVEAISLKKLESTYKNEKDVEVARFKFLKKYLTLDWAEVFFADKIILYEGDTERILLPSMMRAVDEKLMNDAAYIPMSSQNISMIPVGAYAFVFDKFIRFIGKKVLIITDIDSVDRNRKSCKVSSGYSTSNCTLKYYFGNDKNKKELLDKLTNTRNSIDKCVFDKNNSFSLMVTYQTEEQYGGVKYYPRSFEDAFLFINPDADMSGRFDKDQDDWAYNAAKEIRNKKTSFALDVLIKKDFSAQENSDGWQIPPYIKEGLEWLAMD